LDSGADFFLVNSYLVHLRRRQVSLFEVIESIEKVLFILLEALNFLGKALFPLLEPLFSLSKALFPLLEPFFSLNLATDYHSQ